MEILQKENPILHKKAEKVDISNIKKEEIQTLIKEMKETLKTEKDGVALAAPQVGKSIRLFIVIGEFLDKDLICINPKITKLSKKTTWLEEGCLSVRGFYGEVKRSTNCTIEAYDENGEKFERGAGGLLAQIFQHEIDHLDGILFIEKARDLHKINS